MGTGPPACRGGWGASGVCLQSNVRALAALLGKAAFLGLGRRPLLTPLPLLGCSVPISGGGGDRRGPPACISCLLAASSPLLLARAPSASRVGHPTSCPSFLMCCRNNQHAACSYSQRCPAYQPHQSKASSPEEKLTCAQQQRKARQVPGPRSGTSTASWHGGCRSVYAHSGRAWANQTSLERSRPWGGGGPASGLPLLLSDGQWSGFSPFHIKSENRL